MVAFVPAVAVFLVFLVLRLAHETAWSWWWVTAPLWIGGVLTAVMAVFVRTFLGLGGCLAAGAAPDAPEPGRLARVEVKGFRDLGIVRVSETTLAGDPMLHAEWGDGSSADFPPSSLHFITWLPEGAATQPAALPASEIRPCGCGPACECDECSPRTEDAPF